MKKILAFAASNSSTSINHKLATFAIGLLGNVEKRIIKLADYPAPLYSADIENNEGIPKNMLELNRLLNEYDGYIISLPEYNGFITPVFKNTVDWISRYDKAVFKNKPLMLMSTSAGKMAGRTNLKFMIEIMPRWGGKIVSTYSLPNFSENMDIETPAIINKDEKEKLLIAIKAFEMSLE